MAKITLTPLSTFDNNNVSPLNSNLQKVEDALNDRALYRDNVGVEANQMEQELDMNSFRIINLGAPVSNSDALRLADIPVGGAATSAAFVSIADTGGYYTAGNVESALDEVGAELDSVESSITALENEELQLVPFPYSMDELEAEGFYDETATEGVVLSSPIAIGLADGTATKDDEGVVKFLRRAEYTGGQDFLDVNHAVSAHTYAGPNVGASEWTGLFQVWMDPANTTGMTGVALYSQAHKNYENQNAWGFVSEIRDNQADPTGGSYGIETSFVSSGTDNAGGPDGDGARFGMALIHFRKPNDTTLATMRSGIFIAPAEGSETVTEIKRGFEIRGQISEAVIHAKEWDVGRNGGESDFAILPYNARFRWTTNDVSGFSNLGDALFAIDVTAANTLVPGFDGVQEQSGFSPGTSFSSLVIAVNGAYYKIPLYTTTP